MNSFSPISYGFRLAFRRPFIPLAEIAWRWSFAAAAITLVWLFFREYLASLPVTRVDRLLLASNQPVLIFRALHRILSGSAFRFTEAGVLVALGLVVAWIALASLGRVATVNAILGELEPESAMPRTPIRSVVFLNFLRAAVALAAICGLIGAAFFASSFWASTHISIESAFRVFSLISFVTCLTACVLNWFLSLSAIFVVAENSSAVTSIASSVSLLQEHPGPILLTGFVFGVVHLGIFIGAAIVSVSMLSAFAAALPALAWFSLLIIVGVYCAAADFLYTARMAAYVLTMRGPELEPVLPSPAPVMPLSGIDRDELILSDVPLPAM